MLPYSSWTGAEVKAMRTTLGLTQRGFARQIGARYASVSEWETGKALPSAIFCRILTQFAIDADYLSKPDISMKFDPRYASGSRRLLQIADR